MINQGVDIDMWLLEPSGNLYIPYLGTVTPNGTFTNDSANDHVSFEGFMSNEYVQTGDYEIYASLYADPKNLQPAYDLTYRNNQTEQFSLLYGENDPHRLSKEASWTNDETPTLEEADAGAYTDLQRVATVTFNPATTPAPVRPSISRSGSPSLAQRAPGSGPTLAQLRTVRELVKTGQRFASRMPQRRLRSLQLLADSRVR